MDELGRTSHDYRSPTPDASPLPVIPPEATAAPLAAPAPREEAWPGPPTFGVEEEFFVVDAQSRQVSPRAATVLSGAREVSADLCAEITRFQVESAGPVCHTAGQLHTALVESRRSLTDSAAARGLAVTATGTVVLGEVASAPLTDGARYRAIASRFGALREAHVVCGCHVHVAVADRLTAVSVVNHLRPWLPILLALTANSPFQRGRDTGYASWRSILWGRLPSAGPPPWFDSVADHERMVTEMLRSGAILDRRMVYWDVRPSEHLPTLEIRVADVAATVEEAVLFAVLVRGLTSVALRHVAEGRPAPRIPDRVLRLAMWRSARDGLEGAALDPFTVEPVPARRQVDRLVEAAMPGLRAAGETDLVDHLLGRVLEVGSGAHRQRAAHARRGRLSDVVDLLVRQTRHGLEAVEK
ncbi:carboxylate-amine ligase [Marinactinospora thermotolerans]|uniref:Putative glutamate--cysteine ligase 2 n=1 Tax=Marinactinospora thermotolerans DSM 45154 TaxID=1122192 RepID=A0A1T4K8L7_9ACTN|nr:glutamate--cysteine ligase [Marinactinospora thermotolerans]SJZ38746.1 carboxylate-amine ligase [Marinactinospora thermotolerans DSM 45154]